MNWKMITGVLAFGVLVTAGGYIMSSGEEEVLLNIEAGAEEGDHTDEPGEEHGGHDDEPEEGQELTLSEESLRAAGIRIEMLVPIVLGDVVTGPAEIQSNAYRSSVVTPRMPAIVVERHVRLSDTVEAGDPLVTLFSRDVADAEGVFFVADREWRRVRNLGRQVVSERRYLEAEVAREQAEAQLLSYGLGQDAVDAIAVPSKRETHPHGEFTLLANQSGTIVSDDFKNGELVEPGRTLFDVVDLDSVWAIARMNPEEATRISVGARAWVRHNGGVQEANVEQIYSTVDEETRTMNVRLLASNVARALRPGQFVQVEIESVGGEPVLAVPNEALVRSADGDWIIFEQDEDLGLKPVEVERVRVVGEQTVIEGIPAGSSVAVSGAFFLQSELAKSGFDIHNH
jgi:membrane fusion protein, heavy metal efflux system